MKKALIAIVVTVIGGLIVAGILNFFQEGVVEFMDHGDGIEVWNKTGSPVEVNLTIYWTSDGRRQEERKQERVIGSIFIPNRHGSGAQYSLTVTGGGNVYITRNGTFVSGR